MKSFACILLGFAALAASHHHDNVQGLLCKEKATIRRTWQIVTDLPSFGRDVFLTVFSLYPEYKNLFLEFRNVPADQLGDSDRLLFHGGRVLSAIDEVIANIDNPAVSADRLLKLGERHITRGTVRRHFEAFSAAFIDQLKIKGVAANDLAAWRKGWDVIIDILETGLLKRELQLEVTGLSCSEIGDVQGSWAALSGDLQKTGATLFKRLIDIHPEYQQLFRQFRNVELANLETDNGFVAHVYRVIAAFDGIIKELDNNAFIVATLKRLGEQHIARGTDMSHFQNLRPVLIALLKENGLTASQEAAWNKAYSAFEKYISVGLAKLQHIDSVTGLSGLEIKAVLDSWTQVRGNLQAIGKNVFAKLFKAHPQYQQMFRYFRGETLEELIESPKFAAHTQRVVSAFDQTLLALNRPTDFVYMIRELGLDHINRGTDRSHFENFQVVFIEYLKETLGANLNEFTVQSYNHVFEVVINFLSEGLRQADIVDPVTKLTGRQKEQIKGNWNVARKDLRALGKELFVKLFKAHPSYQALFARKGFAEVPIDELKDDERFVAHMASVLRGFDTLIQNLDDTSYFIYALRNLGEDHIKRKAGTEHFRSFEAILIQYFKETQALDENGAAAWAKLFDVMIGVIAQGLKVTGADEADPITGIYGKEIVALRAGFATIGKRQKEVGKKVFAKLIAAHPEYKNLFKAFGKYNLDELPSTDAFDFHIGKVMARFSRIGSVIDDNVSLVYLLKKLGREHIRRGLTRKPFDEFVALYIEEVSGELSELAQVGLQKALTFTNGVIEQGLFQLGQVDEKSLTALEKQVIQDIWGKLRTVGLENLGVKIFEKIFASHDEYKVLFTRFGDVNNIAGNGAFVAHLHRVLSAFDVVINSLDDNALLLRQLKDLGLFHTRLGMTRAHFDNFATAVFSVAEELAPETLTALGRESLGKGFKLMIAVIEEGLLQLEKVNPITGLSTREIDTVKQTWALVKPDLMGIGMRIFRSLFETFPQYQAVFKKFSTAPLSELVNIPAVGKHAIAVTTKLDEFIQTLDEPGNLALLARQLGEEHIVLGVSKSMFKNFGKVLVRLLENDLGQRFPSFATQSWNKALDVFVNFIEEGLQQSFKQDPITGITDDEKDLIQESWELLKPDLMGVGQKVFHVIFAKNPEFQVLFSRVGFGDTPFTALNGNPAFGAHLIKVMKAFDYVIKNLFKPQTLLAYLKTVGSDHIARNVERRHFQAFSDALIVTLKAELKAKLTPEAVSAWRKGLDRLIGIIDQGLLGLKEVNAQNAFSAADIHAIESTWALIKPDLLGKGAAVFRQMFTDHSEYQPLFSNLAGYQVTALEGSPELNAHAANVMGQLDILVGSLENSIQLGKSLIQLGKDHVPRRVNKAHFKDFAEDFIAVLRADLGDKLTPLAESAWKKAFSVMVATIEQGQRGRRSVATFLTNPVA